MPRPRQFDTAAVLERAGDVFWNEGFAAASVQDLCAAMEIAPASLYGAFGDKRALFVAALDSYMRRSQDNFARWAGEARGMAGLEAFFRRLVDRLADHNGRRGCLVTNTAAELAPRDAEIARMVELHLARLEAILAALLAEARAMGQLRAGAGADCAAVLVCLVQGLNVLAKTRPPRARLDAVVDSALRALAARED